MVSFDGQDLAAESALSLRNADTKSGAAGLRWASGALLSIAWVSAAIFALYIVAFYAGAVADGAAKRWNETLPRLYEPDAMVATIGMGAHFITGAILLLLGPIQLIRAVRESMPRLHRWLGRLYVAAALIAGLGGLVFIAVNGTVGGTPMNVGFGLYGALVVVAAVEAIRHARARRFDEHRAWAIRLFALVVGSWLYRMDYGFWKMLAHGAGHTKTFDGPFDVVMTFFFYVPNLIVAEVFIRARHLWTRRSIRLGATFVFSGATALLGLGTYYFTAYHWGPSIVARVLGRSF
jgi:hypothetical protein